MFEKFMDSISSLSTFLAPYPIWVKYLFAGWAVATVVLVLALVLAPRIKSGAETSSSVIENNEAVSLRSLSQFVGASSLDELRKKNGVRALRPTENEMELFRIPNGAYGWVESYKLDTPNIRIPGPPFGPDHPVLPASTKLSQKKRIGADVEIQKSDVGIIYIITFVSDQTRIQLENPSRKEAVSAVLLFRNYKEHNQLLAIPRDRLQYWQHRSFGDGEPVADARIL